MTWESPESRRIRNRVFVIGVLGIVLVLGGVGAYAILSDDADATDVSASAACGADESVHPRTAACVPADEVCNVWLAGSSSANEYCRSTSQDGSGLLQIAVNGSGSMEVRVQTLAGEVVFSETMTLPVERELELEAAPGYWGLLVDFENARGDGRLVLWG
jgi:hypothetical protein